MTVVVAMTVKIEMVVRVGMTELKIITMRKR
jgi:hypothetical protein